MSYICLYLNLSNYTVSTESSFINIVPFNEIISSSDFYANQEYFNTSNGSMQLYNYVGLTNPGYYACFWMVQITPTSQTNANCAFQLSTFPTTDQNNVNPIGNPGYSVYTYSGGANNFQISGNSISYFDANSIIYLTQILPSTPITLYNYNNVSAYLIIYSLGDVSPYSCIGTLSNTLTGNSVGNGQIVNTDNSSGVVFNNIVTSALSTNDDFTFNNDIITYNNINNVLFLCIFMINVCGYYGSSPENSTSIETVNSTNNQITSTSTTGASQNVFGICLNNTTDDCYQSTIINQNFISSLTTESSTENSISETVVSTYSLQQNYQSIGTYLSNLNQGDTLSLDIANSTNNLILQNQTFNFETLTLQGTMTNMIFLPININNYMYCTYSSQSLTTINYNSPIIFNNVVSNGTTLTINNNIITVNSTTNIFLFFTVTIYADANMNTYIPTISLSIGDVSYNFSTMYYCFYEYNVYQITGMIMLNDVVFGTTIKLINVTSSITSPATNFAITLPNSCISSSLFISAF